MNATCGTGVPHVMDPDNHFCCKMRYWRERGGMAAHIPADWNGPSVHERQKAVISEALEAGYEPERVY